MLPIPQIFNEAMPSPPTWSASQIPDLAGRVYVITGGHSGVGLQLSTLLFSHNASLFLLGRSRAAVSSSIASLRAKFPHATGFLTYIAVDLSDLSTIGTAAHSVLAAASRLDCVFHNAGVMTPPLGSTGKQGHELQLVTNVLGPWLLQRALTPLQLATKRQHPDALVRSVWVASLAILFAPRGGLDYDDPHGLRWKDTPWWSPADMYARGVLYAQSKAANVILAKEFQRRCASQGVHGVALNPGNLRTDLGRHVGIAWSVASGFFHDPQLGALTLAYAGVCDEVRGGDYVVPWARVGPDGCVPREIEDADGERLWAFCEAECEGFLE